MTTESSVYLAANVRRHREKLGLSQKELAAQIGWEQSRLSEIETANADRKLSYVDELARALGMPAYQLLKPPPKMPIKLQTKIELLNAPSMS